MVVHDPLQAAAHSETSFAHEPSNIWVIRKQTRRKRPGMEDDVVVLATYYVVGDCIYMAPSIASVIGHRVVSVVILAGALTESNEFHPSSCPPLLLLPSYSILRPLYQLLLHHMDIPMRLQFLNHPTHRNRYHSLNRARRIRHFPRFPAKPKAPVPVPALKQPSFKIRAL
jgi:hypothetical protein